MNISYKIINKVSELPDFDKSLPIFSDIETDGLYGPIRMIQLYQPQTSQDIFIIDLAPIGYNKSVYSEEVIKVEDFIMGHYTVWYNSSYDLGTLNISPSMGIKHPDEVTKDTKYESKVDDLFYLMKMAYPEFKEFGLKKVVTKLRYTQGMYDGINTKENPKGFVLGAYIATQAYKYGALDVYALSLMWEDTKIQKTREVLAYKVDMISQAYALIYQQNGLVLHRKLWQDKLIEAEKNVIKYTAMLPAGFNPNSFKQVRALLNIERSDREALTILSLGKDERAKNADTIIKLKRYKKQVSYLTSINFNKMYTKFNVYGALTGRFTSSGGDLVDGFNAQQIPRDFQILFNSPTKDTVVIDADYSTLELRLAAAIYNEVNMYNLLKDGKDLHTAMAETISGKKVHPEKGVIKVTTNFRDSHKDDIPWITSNDRQNAKVVNFGFVFGMSAAKFIVYAKTSYGIEYIEQEGRELRDKYFKMYPSVLKYHKNVWNNYKRPGYVVSTALGRRIKPIMGTDAINIPVQGSGAETTKLAVHYLIKDNPDIPILKYIYNVVHDAIYLRVPRGLESKIGPLLEKAMLKGWTEISKSSLFHFKDIPMIAEVEYNDNL